MSVSYPSPDSEDKPCPSDDKPDTTDWRRIGSLAISGVKEWKHCLCHPENKIPAEWDCCWVCKGPDGANECQFRRPMEERHRDMLAEPRYAQAVRRVTAGERAGYYKPG